MLGKRLFRTMSFFPIPRIFFTASTLFLILYPEIVPDDNDSCETNVTHELEKVDLNDPNMGREMTGWGVGILND